MRRLRKYAPLSAPVRLVQRKDPKCWFGGTGSGASGRERVYDRVKGYALTFHQYEGEERVGVARFRIVIDSRLTLSEKWDVIVHEWAHCLDRQTRAWSKDCHDARWGQCYAKAWKASTTWEY